MKEILEAIIKKLVANKDAVSINEKSENNFISLEVKVAESDIGKVIGKDGRIAKSIRTIMKALATKEEKKISIEFIS